MDIFLLVLLSGIMLKIAYLDYKEQYIYDLDVGIAGIITIAYAANSATLYSSVIGGICGFAIGYVIYAVAKMVYGEEAFGFGDVLLLGVLGKLVDKGNTILVIEHNEDIIRSADWIIEMGPGGGRNGGEILYCGEPKEEHTK